MEFVEEDLTGARYLRCVLRNVVIRGSDTSNLEIDDPHLHEGVLLVNDVDVVPFVEAELNRRFPGRDRKFATSPADLRLAWAAVEEAWEEALVLAQGREDVSVDGEWSFSQTLRHLVLATNTWLHGAVLEHPRPFHEIGLPFAEYESYGGDMSGFREPSSFDEVLSVRRAHQKMVREFLANLEEPLLDERRANPWAREEEVSVLDCLHVILNEEWQHLRYAVRDLRSFEHSRPQSPP